MSLRGPRDERGCEGAFVVPLRGPLEGGRVGGTDDVQSVVVLLS